MTDEYVETDDEQDAEQQQAVGRISGTNSAGLYGAAQAAGARAAGRPDHRIRPGGPIAASPRAAWQPGSDTPTMSSADYYAESARPRGSVSRPDHRHAPLPTDHAGDNASMLATAHAGATRNPRPVRSAADMQSARASDVELLRQQLEAERQGWLAERKVLTERLEALERGRK